MENAPIYNPVIINDIHSIVIYLPPNVNYALTGTEVFEVGIYDTVDYLQLMPSYILVHSYV